MPALGLAVPTAALLAADAPAPVPVECEDPFIDPDPDPWLDPISFDDDWSDLPSLEVV